MNLMQNTARHITLHTRMETSLKLYITQQLYGIFNYTTYAYLQIYTKVLTLIYTPLHLSLLLLAQALRAQG
jgi:hypothetical protein